MGTLPATPGKFVNERLAKELKEHHASASDLAYFMDITSSAVEKWKRGKNAITYGHGQRMAFVLGLTLDELSNTGDYPYPVTPREPDLVELSRHIIEVADGGVRLRSQTLRIDAKARAEKYLLAHGGKPSAAPAPAPAPAPKPAVVYSPGPRQAVPEIPRVPDFVIPQIPHIPDSGNADHNRIALMLKNLEKLRRETGIEWFIRPEGSLGARRIITEEF